MLSERPRSTVILKSSGIVISYSASAGHGAGERGTRGIEGCQEIGSRACRDVRREQLPRHRRVQDTDGIMTGRQPESVDARRGTDDESAIDASRTQPRPGTNQTRPRERRHRVERVLAELPHAVPGVLPLEAHELARAADVDATLESSRTRLFQIALLLKLPFESGRCVESMLGKRSEERRVGKESKRQE